MSVTAGNLIVVVGGQFGSEGKGHAAAQLAARCSRPLVIRVGGPNAGHTVYDQAGRQFKLRHLPTAALQSDSVLALGAGSEVDLELLREEMIVTGRELVYVDSQATVLDRSYAQAELDDPSKQGGTSTQVGVGEARAARVNRKAKIVGQLSPRLPNGVFSRDVASLARRYLNGGGTVLIEGAQGYGLGLHAGFYPKTTSTDCRSIDALAAVGVPPWGVDARLEIWVVVRPYPIRIAGDSGPLQDETSWEELGLPAERTTVTKKVRRVGGWDPDLVAGAISANGGPNNPQIRVWLSMADHVVPGLKGASALPQDLSESDKHELENWISLVVDCGAAVGALGTGPDTAIFLGPRWAS